MYPVGASFGWSWILYANIISNKSYADFGKGKYSRNVRWNCIVHWFIDHVKSVMVFFEIQWVIQLIKWFICSHATLPRFTVIDPWQEHEAWTIPYLAEMYMLLTDKTWTLSSCLAECTCYWHINPWYPCFRPVNNNSPQMPGLDVKQSILLAY